MISKVIKEALDIDVELSDVIEIYYGASIIYRKFVGYGFGSNFRIEKQYEIYEAIVSNTVAAALIEECNNASN